MRELKYVHIGERLRDERLRLGLSQVDFSEFSSASRNALVQWERGETTPNASVLGVMATLGVDVLYVVTGARAGASIGTLTPAERELLQAWRNGPAQVRAVLDAAAKLVAPNAAADAGTSASLDAS